MDMQTFSLLNRLAESRMNETIYALGTFIWMLAGTFAGLIALWVNQWDSAWFGFSLLSFVLVATMHASGAREAKWRKQYLAQVACSLPIASNGSSEPASSNGQ